MFNNSLETIGTNYHKNCVVSENKVPIDSKMQSSTLSEVCNLVTDGTHDTPKTLKNGVPFIKAKEIVGGIIDFENCEYISYEDHLKVIARSNPEKGDILFAHIGASLGEAAFIKTDKEFSIKNIALFKPNPSKIDNRYLFYYVIGPKFQNEIKNCRTGSAQPFVSLEFLRNHLIEYHTNLEIQHKIASVLSAYDDLIENNTLRIRILEVMAQALYREWFVKFRFPGHEKVRMVESELGMVPEGWEVKKLGDVCNILMGQSPKSEFYNDTGEGLPFHQGVTDFGDRFPTDRMYCTVQNRIAEAGDVLFSVRAPVGRINIADKKIVIGRGLCAIRSRSGNQAFVFQQLKEQFKEEDTMGGGTIFKSVTKEDMYKIRFLVPSEALLNNFEEIMAPIFVELKNLTIKNANLRRTRDLLLPKLISGEINMEKIEIRMPDN